MNKSPLLTACLVLILLAGCGSSRVPVYPAKITVRSGDQAAVGAEVTLHPISEELKTQKIFPNGRAEDDGLVELTTFRQGDGAPEGEYKVTIVWLTAPKQGDDPEGDVIQTDKLGGAYANPNRTSLHVSIKPSSSNETILQVKQPVTP